MRKPRLPLPLVDVWRPTFVALLLISIVIGMLVYKLPSLQGGASQAEVEFVASARGIGQVIENPLNIIQKLPYVALDKIGHLNLLSARLVNVVIGFGAIIAFYLILRSWYSTKVALLGGMLFTVSSWLLNITRLATPDASVLLLLLLVLSGLWLQAEHRIRLCFLVGLPVLIGLLYVPGLVWLLVPVLIWHRRLIASHFRAFSPWTQAFVSVVGLISLAPLVWSFVNGVDLIVTWLGAPNAWPGPVDYLQNLAQIPVNLVWHSSQGPVYGIDGVPLIEVFTVASLVLGLYVAAYSIKLDRNRLIFGWLIVATLLIGLGGPIKISLLLPFVYLLVGGGIALLLQQWFTVFPRNPLARRIGVLILSLVVGMACFYHAQRYYEAWPHVPATKEAFSKTI